VQVLLTGTLLVTGMLLGLAGQALVAYFFGAGPRTDALFLARDVADLAAKLFLPTQAASVLLPLYVGLRTRAGDDAAWRAVQAILTVLLGAMTPVLIGVVLLADPLVSMLAPGFPEDRQELAADLLRILAASGWFTLLSALATVLLQGRGRFGRAMLANVAGGLVVVASIVPLVGALGIEGAALAFLAGIAVQAMAGATFLVAEGMPARPRLRGEGRHVREFAFSTAPFLLNAASSQVNGVVLRIAASTLATGLYAAFSLAGRLFRAVIALVLGPVQYVLLPALTQSEAIHDRERADAELMAFLRQVVFLTTPVVAVLAVLNGATVSLVFERGEFNDQDTRQTAAVLAVYAFAVLPTGVYLMLEQAAYARRRSGTVASTNIATDLSQAALFLPFVALFGAPGLAFSALFGSLVAMAIYVARLRPLRRAHVRRNLRFAAEVTASGLVAALATHGMAEVVRATVAPDGGFEQAAVVLPGALTGALAYLAVARALRIREPLVLAAALLSIVRDARGRQERQR
jgi:putative peptidoglycan lipid II flippase